MNIQFLSLAEYIDIRKDSISISKQGHDDMWVFEVEHPKRGKVILIQGSGNGGLLIQSELSEFYESLSCEGDISDILADTVDLDFNNLDFNNLEFDDVDLNCLDVPNPKLN